jgi:hypothetical protein
VKGNFTSFAKVPPKQNFALNAFVFALGIALMTLSERGALLLSALVMFPLDT